MYWLTDTHVHKRSHQHNKNPLLFEFPCFLFFLHLYYICLHCFAPSSFFYYELESFLSDSIAALWNVSRKKATSIIPHIPPIKAQTRMYKTGLNMEKYHGLYDQVTINPLRVVFHTVSIWIRVIVIFFRDFPPEFKPAAHFLKFHKSSLGALVWFKATTDAVPLAHSNLDLSPAESAIPPDRRCGASGRWSGALNPVSPQQAARFHLPGACMATVPQHYSITQRAVRRHLLLNLG